MIDDDLPTHCERCGDRLTTDDECEFGVCLECCREEARQAIDDECDRLAAEATGLATTGPWMPEPVDSELPF